MPDRRGRSLVGSSTAHLSRPHWRDVGGGLLVIAVAVLFAWALARPQISPPGAAVRAVADCAAVVTLGLAVVPFLDAGRHRAELVRSAAVPLTAGAALWLLAELVRLIVATAQAASLSVGSVGVSTYTQFVLHTAVGRAGALSALAAAVVCAMAVVAPRSVTVAVATIGVVAVGLVAHTLTGHLTDSPLGGLSVAVHALAAALWCGTLAALLLTVRHRGQWARVLPRFAQVALICVAVLVLAGVAAGLATVGAPRDLYETGYGRLLLAKVLVTVALTMLAWRNRTHWLPAARAHRATAGLSRSRTLVELAIMAVALTLGAALAVTG
ncbi:CopD family protein [Mycolicibacterium sp. S2-37]|uniref:copper resistance D family protein n=1 Tax=Mycolicibacterium sp. S2-37 TaxID=2810297 RepID=UPI001A93D07A|nr:CopD family protein [Mycolicibacterium sp. S2-37]MBO0679820.1 CopD family protein [Mycolicibacterium sp. S2-37]MBO0681217.1 CopD family protein [Mycolicibacterium sp. S2-37]